MAANWTTEQAQVISARNHALLVSAAAGAGKTAVLTARILSLVCGDLPGTQPVDIDRLLVVTFTRAAAAEMRERISDELHVRLEADPDNAHLQRQVTLLHHAQICTIDSFCTSLLRTYFYEIGIDPGFRIADEGELKLRKQELVEALLEECYEEGTPEFLSFVEYFAAGKNDRCLEELILQLYEKSQSHPNPEEWLARALDVYEADTQEMFWDSVPGQMLTDQVVRQAEGCAALVQRAQALIDSPEGPKEYEKALAAEAACVRTLTDPSARMEWYDALQAKKTVSLRKAKGEKSEDARQLADETADCIRAIRKAIDEIKKMCLPVPPQEMTAQLSVCRVPAAQLVFLTRAFAARFFAAKQEKNVLDFGDVEHLALRVLTDEKGNPTQTALELRDSYAQIMIDEYQDSNLLQERLLTAIAKEDGSNLFLVGDVKQSIYQFRQAHPELFMEKLDTYAPIPASENVCAAKDAVPRSISLHKNFRSRPEVLNSANAVFAALMQREAGGIAYDDAARLHVGADYASDESYRTEVLAFCTNALSEAHTRTDAITAEASLAADRIPALTDPKNGLMIGTGEERHIARYGDIVILLRSRAQWMETFVRVLMENGIPAYGESRTGFYETQEIQTVLQYLSLLDNMQQDRPMAAVLTSPIGGFSADDLAKVRIAFPDQPFYTAVRSYSAYGTDGKLCLRLQRFFARVQAHRACVPHMQIHDLLWKLYRETGYYEFASAMPGGALRRANLDMLVQQALAFEQTSYRGLFHFLRYVEQIRKYELDIGEASALSGTVDAVRIMTIHKSKGLEFPIVFLSGMCKQFNDLDERQPVVISGTGGFGVDVVDTTLRVRQPSAVKRILKRQVYLESRAEEIRVLYVAMTRAQEKLIFTAGYKEKDEIVHGVPRPLLYQEIVSANSPWKWLKNIVGTDAEAFSCTEVSAENLETSAADRTDVFLSGGAYSPEPLSLREGVYPEAPEAVDPDETDRLYDEAKAALARIAYVYPYDGPAHPAKVSVSDLKRRAMQEAGEQSVGALYEEPVPVPLLPKFAAPTKENVAAARGTAYHKVLECVDFTEDAAGIRTLLQTLVDDGRLRAQDAQSVDPAQIAAFIQSPLGARMRQAACADKLKREQPFVYGVPASALYEGVREDEQVMIQGVIDAFFEEDGALVLVDYKTDRVSQTDGEETLLARYRVQLSCYARALSALLEKPVKEAYLYAFALGKAVRCPL